MGMTNRDVDAAVIAIAAAQRGWFSAGQATAVGADRGLIGRRVDAGAWARRHEGVYKLVAYPDSFVGDLWAAHLAAGPTSYVSHEAAAHLQLLTGFGRQQQVLTVPHPGHARLQGVTVHQLTDAHLHELTVIEGLAVTTVPWTLVDVAAVASKARVRAALDDALAARLTKATEVGTCLATVARRGKPGVVKLARLLDRHAEGPVPPRSVLERYLVEGLTAAGEPLPTLQFAFPGRYPMPGCADGCYVDAKLIVETDGRRWHTRIADIARDRARDNEAARAGHQTLRFLHEHVVNDIDDVVATIREVRLGRLNLFGFPA
ncbi:MAG: hypothetical protein QOG87_952 [Actinomycetota bacterium]|jgi:hypothetical protein